MDYCIRRASLSNGANRDTIVEKAAVAARSKTQGWNR